MVPEVEIQWWNHLELYPNAPLEPAGIQERPNLFRVARFPNSELASSNTLAWLLDPMEDHGLGTFVLESLLERINRPGDVSSDVTVETETVTGKGNRIDVLVRLSNLAVVIENKVLSGPGNDLAGYQEYARDENGTDAAVVVFRPQHQDDLDRYRNDGLEPGRDLFEVLYDDLFGVVLTRMGAHVMESDPRGVDLLMQYIDNYSPKRKKAAMKEYERTISRFIERARGIEPQITAFCRALSLYSEHASWKLGDLCNVLQDRIQEGFLVASDGSLVMVAKPWIYPRQSYIAEPYWKHAMFHGMKFHLEGRTADEDVAIELFTNTYPDYKDVCYDPVSMSARPESFDMLGYKAYRYCQGRTDSQMKRNFSRPVSNNDFYHVFDDAHLSDPLDQLSETIGNHYRDILGRTWNTTLMWRG